MGIKMIADNFIYEENQVVFLKDEENIRTLLLASIYAESSV